MSRTIVLLCALLSALALGAAPTHAKGKTPAAAKPAEADPGGTGCDPIDPAVCMLPFPNDFFTRPDDST